MAAQQRRQPSQIDPVLIPRLASVETTLNWIKQTLADNANRLNNAFMVVDLHVAVLYRVSNDLADVKNVGGLPVDKVYRNNDGHLDLARYMEELQATVTIATAFRSIILKAAAEAPKEQPAATDPSLVALPDFGGDYESAQR